MLTVLSPAKSLDYESPLATRKHSEPTMLDRSAELVEIMAGQSPRKIGKLMGISESLAELNFERFQNWEQPFTPETSRQALLAFNGDVYMGMDAANRFGARDFTHAQKTLRILSGLYGVLRPLDLMMPYRLEMGTKLKNPGGADLYAFWGDEITDRLNADIKAGPGAKVLVNLASNEYFKSVRTDKLDYPVVTPSFLDAKGDGDYKTVAVFAKRARGAMAGWMVQQRAASVDELTKFDELGYAYDPDRSTDDKPTFTRRHDG